MLTVVLLSMLELVGASGATKMSSSIFPGKLTFVSVEIRQKLIKKD